jgi:BirA family biotin operon repressor/biotin-[acetyl-CoA-carboxylase] ligase
MNGEVKAAVRIVRRETTGSTNADALELARAGDAGPLWVVATEQTGGRGRRGRAWHSPPGNLYASHLLVDPCASDHAPQLGFVAGIALVDAVRTLAPVDAALKWPNDLLVDGAKCAGILLEATRLPQTTLACVIGIGVNCRFHPADLPYRATDLSAAAGRDIAPERLLDALARTFAHWTRCWDRGANFAAIRTAWLERAAGLGAPVEIRQHDATIAGRFETIDDSGRMVVATSHGSMKVDAGDVSFSGGLESLARVVPV